LISVVGDLKLGNFTLSFADLSVPVAGVPISVVRTYDTLNSEETDDFGYGWRMEFRDTNLRTNVPRTGSEEDLIFNPFFAGARVFLQLPGGKREGFTFQPKRAPGLRGSFLGIFEPSFIPDRGVTSQLTVPNTSLSVSATGDVFAYGSGQPFHPASPLFGNTYRLTTAEGITYEIDGTSGDLRTIVDLNGNEVKFDDNEIASSSGPKVQFERDAQRRIVSVIDPAGQEIRYTYDRFGDLTAVTDRAGNTTRFIYRSDRPHYLEKILDPLGREGIRTEYDESGRLTRTVDALGNAVRQDYDLANSTVTVFDQLGNPTKFEYDNDGNIVTETNALGEVIRRTYDSVGNVLEEINPLGQKTIRTYDRLGNVLTEKDPLGNTTYTVYGSNG
jgi:YD repeat-containing protein